ncbi:nuclear transport factor 2 family protein [Labrys sp. LIt4]|uniref:nuclear transport factor 2 family protein n=1 Tax=Labrys sp. LIt4 TaxID=2821355 RepID=UPI001AE06C37|nr:nuclear transport factor 2 family protein [Labrys sp. LIt4]MBP0581622.1 nuclear transport factor 2 family protein [Labrys sp. LIt4]
MTSHAPKDPGFEALVAALQTYFDGLYHSDTERLRQVFHPQALYACASEGSLTHLGMAEYFPIVDNRPSPASRNEERADRIISIEFAGPVTAFARVECAIGPKHFTDLLTFVHLDGRWQIISKVFHFDLHR